MSFAFLAERGKHALHLGLEVCRCMALLSAGLFKYTKHSGCLMKVLEGQQACFICHMPEGARTQPFFSCTCTSAYAACGRCAASPYKACARLKALAR